MRRAGIPSIAVEAAHPGRGARRRRRRRQRERNLHETGKLSNEIERVSVRASECLSLARLCLMSMASVAKRRLVRWLSQ